MASANGRALPPTIISPSISWRIDLENALRRWRSERRTSRSARSGSNTSYINRSTEESAEAQDWSWTRMNLLDRSLIRSFLKSYVVVLVSLLSLYIIVDLFMNLEDFADRHRGLSGVLRHIGSYYGHRVSQIFDRLSEAIVLLAAM